MLKQLFSITKSEEMKVLFRQKGRMQGRVSEACDSYVIDAKTPDSPDAERVSPAGFILPSVPSVLEAFS
jgi:hypothetical protein